MKARWLTLLAALASLVVLAGCANTLPVPDRPPGDAITRFAFSGRLAIRQGETRHHLNIDWQHAPLNDNILLTTPLGQGVAEITRDSGGARLLLADKREYAAPDAETLSEQVFGFRLPLANALDWLLGKPGDYTPWRVTVIERESEAPQALPGVLELERDDIHVRLKIDEWSEVE